MSEFPGESYQLIVADIDGCLSKGGSSPYSPRLIEKLIETNMRSREDPACPAITFCTGRPQPYVECLIQVTHGYTPALCEAGMLLFDPQSHAVHFHPEFGSAERQIVESLRREITARLIRPGVMFEPGKVTHHTLLLSPPLRPADLIEEARDIASKYDGLVEVETTRFCIHFLFRHLHKGAGIEWLSQYTGVPLRNMAGIGDARPDLPFLKRVGLSCAPLEAQDDVKQICNIVSGNCDAEAMIELVDHCLRHNANLASPSETGIKT
jgi:hydroxymethylpyrimidine pyrophosphatase-like HAD family hydrolase